jgi:hypothetical protein
MSCHSHGVTRQEVEEAVEHARGVWSEAADALDHVRSRSLVDALQRLSRELPVVGPTLDIDGMDAWTTPLDQAVRALSSLGRHELAHELAWTLVDVFIVQRGGVAGGQPESP